MIRVLISVLLACVLVFTGVTPVSAMPGNTETLLPDAAGNYEEWTPGGGSNWSLVDDPVGSPDDDTTKVSAHADMDTDSYNLQASEIPAGSSITVRVYFRTEDPSVSYSCDIYPGLRLGGVDLWGTKVDIPSNETWTTRSEIIARPGGGDWNVTDLANLEVMIKGTAGGPSTLNVTQVYIEVDYISPPAITTDAATYVAKTTARLNSTVTDDGWEACDVRFGYGDETQTAENFESYDTKTDWVEDEYETGQHPYVDIESLTADHGYFYRAQIRNASGTVTSTTEIQFTTETIVSVPTNLKAFPGSTSVGLTWTKGDGASETMIRYSEVTYPTDETEGTLAYLGTLAGCTIIGLEAGHTYYIVGIGKSGADYSGTTEVLATTTAGTPEGETPGVPTTPPTWFQSPDHTVLSGLPLYNQINALFEAFGVPLATGWFLSTIFGCTMFGLAAYTISHRKPTLGLVALAVALAIASLVKLLPMFMMAFTVIFMMGAWHWRERRR